MHHVAQQHRSKPISLGGFSEAQHLVDPAVLEKVFESSFTRLIKKSPHAMKGEIQDRV
jgi:hypothetical protein